MVQRFNELETSRNSIADEFHALLKNKGINFATGVPCGVLKHFIQNFDSDKDIAHIPALNEPEAISLAAGAYLGGKNPVVYMQNSGLLKSINEIGSLLLPYQIPILGIVTYRGCEGEDAPHHFFTGRSTYPVLDSLGLHVQEFDKEKLNEIVNCSFDAIRYGLSSIILVKRGWQGERKEKSSTEKKSEKSPNTSSETKNRQVGEIIDLTTKELTMKREQALDTIINLLSDKDAVFSTTGLISRSIYENHDSSNRFYSTGSFGFASSIALGFALTKPNIRTYVIDGDSSVLTNFGTLVTIGVNSPQNLMHIILDNNAYGSCSEEKSCSDHARIPEVAQIEGYKKIFVVNDAEGLGKALTLSKDISGPQMIYADIELGGRRDFERPSDLAYVAKRFKSHFGS